MSEFARKAFLDCVEAAQMARRNATHRRRAGDREAARNAFERGCWYLDLARRRRAWK